MHSWVIPYKPNMFVQLRMDNQEAVELVDELEAIVASGSSDSRVVELIKHLRQANEKAERLRDD
jgi:hypothetical protein